MARVFAHSDVSASSIFEEAQYRGVTRRIGARDGFVARRHEPRSPAAHSSPEWSSPGERLRLGPSSTCSCGCVSPAAIRVARAPRGLIPVRSADPAVPRDLDKWIEAPASKNRVRRAGVEPPGYEMILHP